MNAALLGHNLCHDCESSERHDVRIMSVSELHWLWRETVRFLDGHAERVREGKDLNAALEFAKYVQWCGLLQFFKANESPEPFKVDGALVQWKAEELQRAVREWWTTPGKAPKIEVAELAQIREKLDLIAGRLSRQRPFARPGRAL